MNVYGIGSSLSGRGNPNKFDMKIPRVIRIYVSEPRDPFISVGDNSLIKLGINTEKAPAANPKINRPKSIMYSFFMQVSAHPITTRILVKCIDLSFPYFSAGGPATKLPMADPRAHIDVISPFHRLI
jgi:hypothetical protein